MGQGLTVEASLTIALRHTTLSRTPLDEWPARRRDLYLTTHNTQKRHTSMSPGGFEPAVPTSERPQAHALDRAATGIGRTHYTFRKEILILACRLGLHLTRVFPPRFSNNILWEIYILCMRTTFPMYQNHLMRSALCWDITRRKPEIKVKIILLSRLVCWGWWGKTSVRFTRRHNNEHPAYSGGRI